MFRHPLPRTVDFRPQALPKSAVGTSPAGDANAKLTGRPLPLLPGVTGEARFSDDSRHRYELSRIKAPGAPFALFMISPRGYHRLQSVEESGVFQ